MQFTTIFLRRRSNQYWMQTDTSSRLKFMIFAISNVKAGSRHCIEALAREIINASVRFLEAVSAGENCWIKYISKNCCLPEKRDFDRTIAKEAYFMTLIL